MAHAERPCAKARDRATGTKRLGRDLRSMKCFQPVAKRVSEYDEIAHAPLVREYTGTARDLHAGALQLVGERIERGAIGDFPAVERHAVASRIHDYALLAVIHAQRERRAALLDQLHAEKTRGVTRPVFEIFRFDPDVSERLERHDSLASQPAHRTHVNDKSYHEENDAEIGLGA